ncbi:MAG: hypothetical protein IJC76_09885 [Lachnospiraceae bacterium]|nr:hypothetical protein [Lachnospiraceae bacterium]
MICKCPNCGEALSYNIDEQLLLCPACDSNFNPNDAVDEETISEYETMQCDIYSCTTCGAEIAVNDVEAATFCAYCGQPTIIFNRVASQKKPEFIIPFSITREQAEEAIRNHLRRGFFVDGGVKNFQTERICGIYVPFWLYDVFYSSNQVLRGTIKHGKYRQTHYYRRISECTFNKVTVDASRRLQDESSQRLEPFDTTALKPFEAGYLSGFYADCYDSTSQDKKFFAVYKVKELFNQEVIKSVPADNVKITQDNPTHEILSETYAMLPVWFLSFIHEDKGYTIMVNGQTGKTVGAVPYVKFKIKAAIMILGTLLSGLAIKFLESDLYSHPKDFRESLFIYIVLIFISFSYGAKQFKKLKKSIGLTTAESINKFAKERQDG